MKDILLQYFKFYLTTAGDLDQAVIDSLDYDAAHAFWLQRFRQDVINEINIDYEDWGWEGQFSDDGQITFNELIATGPNLYGVYFGSLLHWAAHENPEVVKQVGLGVANAMVSQLPEGIQQIVGPAINTYLGSKLDVLMEIDPNQHLDAKFAEVQAALQEITDGQWALFEAYHELLLENKTILSNQLNMKKVMDELNHRTNGMLFMLEAQFDFNSAQFSAVRNKLDELGVNQQIDIQLTVAQMAAQVMTLAAEHHADAEVVEAYSKFDEAAKNGNIDLIESSYTSFMTTVAVKKALDQQAAYNKQSALNSLNTAQQVLNIVKGLIFFVKDDKLKFNLSIAASTFGGIFKACKAFLTGGGSYSGMILTLVETIVSSIVAISKSNYESPEQQRHQQLLDTLKELYENLSLQLDQLKMEVIAGDAELLGALDNLSISVSGIYELVSQLNETVEYSMSEMYQSFRNSTDLPYETWNTYTFIAMDEYNYTHDHSLLNELQNFYRLHIAHSYNHPISEIFGPKLQNLLSSDDLNSKMKKIALTLNANNSKSLHLNIYSRCLSMFGDCAPITNSHRNPLVTNRMILNLYQFANSTSDLVHVPSYRQQLVKIAKELHYNHVLKLSARINTNLFASLFGILDECFLRYTEALNNDFRLVDKEVTEINCKLREDVFHGKAIGKQKVYVPYFRDQYNYRIGNQTEILREKVYQGAFLDYLGFFIDPHSNHGRRRIMSNGKWALAVQRLDENNGVMAVFNKVPFEETEDYRYYLLEDIRTDEQWKCAFYPSKVKYEPEGGHIIPGYSHLPYNEKELKEAILASCYVFDSDIEGLFANKNSFWLSNLLSKGMFKLMEQDDNETYTSLYGQNWKDRLNRLFFDYTFILGDGFNSVRNTFSSHVRLKIIEDFEAVLSEAPSDDVLEATENISNTVDVLISLLTFAFDYESLETACETSAGDGNVIDSLLRLKHICENRLIPGLDRQDLSNSKLLPKIYKKSFHSDETEINAICEAFEGIRNDIFIADWSVRNKTMEQRESMVRGEAICLDSVGSWGAINVINDHLIQHFQGGLMPEEVFSENSNQLIDSILEAELIPGLEGYLNASYEAPPSYLEWLDRLHRYQTLVQMGVRQYFENECSHQMTNEFFAENEGKNIQELLGADIISEHAAMRFKKPHGKTLQASINNIRHRFGENGFNSRVRAAARS